MTREELHKKIAKAQEEKLDTVYMHKEEEISVEEVELSIMVALIIMEYELQLSDNGTYIQRIMLHKKEEGENIKLNTKIGDFHNVFKFHAYSVNKSLF